MDPALARLLEEGGPDDEVAVILRLADPAAPPPGVRIVAQFGPIATCRVRRGAVADTRASPNVISVKAPRVYGPDVEEEDPSAAVEPPTEAVLDGDERRPGPAAGTGRGVVVGFIDWGCDVAHPDFRGPSGETRLLALWDQRPGPSPARPNRYGYGVIHDAADINRALASDRPYEALAYDPADSDIGIGAHGTHTMSIAIGNGRGGGPVGVAPEASPVFVHLSTWGPQGPNRLGDSVALLEAVDFIARVAGERPWVINMSLGRHCGPHDGTTLVEQGLDALLDELPGRSSIHSGGNYFGRGVHAAGRLRPGDRHELAFTAGAAELVPHELDLWYPGGDRLLVTLISPDGSLRATAPLGESSILRVDGRLVARVDHRRRDPNNGANEVLATIHAGAPVGTWRLALTAEEIVDGRFNAWLERTVGQQAQPRFVPDDVVTATTTGTICNGRRTLAVGAYDAQSEYREVASFSSCGPTADGRAKPDLLAPGVSVLAARSAPRAAGADAPQSTRMSGTSMAAPHVCGAVALIFAATPRPLRIHETHNLLLASATPAPPDAGDPDRVGSGYLDIDAAVEAARRLAPRAGHEEEDEMTLAHEPSLAPVAEDVEATVVVDGVRSTIQPDPSPPEETAAGIDAALQLVLARSPADGLLRGPLHGGEVRVARWTPPSLPSPPPPWLRVDADADLAALVAGGAVYLPDPTSPAAAGERRWVQVPGLREWYRLPPASQRRQRRRWVDALATAQTTFSRQRLDALASPVLRLLLAQHAATAVPVRPVNQPERRFLGAANHWVTIPTLPLPLTEPACYLPVIARREGGLEAINAYDLGAGISVGPIQLNVQRGALFRILWRLWSADRELFDRELGTPLGWAMRAHDDHVDLVVQRGDAPDLTLHGRSQEQRAIIGYLQSGTPGHDGFASIDQAFRHRLAERFRNLAVWPAVQQIVLDVTAWWLEPGLRRVEAAGLPPLDRRNPDRATFVLKALLLSAFVRYSGCLARLLDALSAWATPEEKLANWRGALATTASPCPRLLERLERQHREAEEVFAELRLVLGVAEAQEGEEEEVEWGRPAWETPPWEAGPLEAAAAGWVPPPAEDELEASATVELAEAEADAVPATPCGEAAAWEASLPGLAELADAIVAEAPTVAARSLLADVLQRANGRLGLRQAPGGAPSPSPAELFDAFVTPGRVAGRHLQESFDVVAAPRALLAGVPQAGDLLVRRGERGFGHVAVVATPGAWTREQLPAVGLVPEGPAEGIYVHVVEGGARPHAADAGFARLVADGGGRLPANTLVLRAPSGEAPDDPAGSLLAAGLHWPGATPEQLGFMRDVYERHVAAAARRRPFVGDVPDDELAVIEDGRRARTAVAAACRALLQAAKADLAADRAALGSGVVIRVVSAYRPASRQFAAWQANFPRYYRNTAADRAALDGGEHGREAVAYLARYIGRRLGAPGYSLHNDGRAVDFGTTEAGHVLTADTSPASVAAWRRSWLFAWLDRNAARWDFFQNTSIDEPWHWEHRGPQPARVAEAGTESVTVPAARVEVAQVPLLAGHRGSAPDLIVKWNDMTDPVEIDVVVHLHGHSSRGERMRLPDDKEPLSGLDFHDPDRPADPATGRTRPTVCVLPRGNWFGGGTGAGYDFPALVAPTGLQELVDLAFTRVRAIAGEGIRRGRLVLTAHSGGGAALMRILRHNDPDEVHVFDALYTKPAALIAWAEDHIRRDAAATAAGRSRAAAAGALRVLYVPGTRTERYSRAVHRALCEALAASGSGAPLADRYRVEQTRTSHSWMPRRYGWRLLADASADLPATDGLPCPEPAAALAAGDEAEPEAWTVPINGDGWRAEGAAAGAATLVEARPVAYDRAAALAYARRHWNVVCSDSFIATGTGRGFRKVPAGTAFVHEFDAAGASRRREHALLPDGSRVEWEELDDCTHYISCCIGRPPGDTGGGLPLPSVQLGRYPNAPYGIVRVATIVEHLKDRRWVEVVARDTTEREHVQALGPGDLIAYKNRRGRYAHLALYLGGGKIGCHTYCRFDDPACTWDNDWDLGAGQGWTWTFLRFRV